MHHGIYEGVNAAKRAKRILILGESHHISKSDEANMKAGRAATYKTSSVVEEHIAGANSASLEFFRKIGRSFGCEMKTKQNREDFWSNVYFGNYIEVLCGIKDNAAKRILKVKNGSKTNREIYNDNLFNFINDNEIDIVVCFGKLVFNNLPSLNKAHLKEEDTVLNAHIGKCIYLPDIPHNKTSVILKKPLEAYSLKHPSSYGFNAEIYVDILGKLL